MKNCPDELLKVFNFSGVGEERKRSPRGIRGWVAERYHFLLKLRSHLNLQYECCGMVLRSSPSRHLASRYNLLSLCSRSMIRRAVQRLPKYQPAIRSVRPLFALQSKPLKGATVRTTTRAYTCCRRHHSTDKFVAPRRSEDASVYGGQLKYTRPTTQPPAW